MIYEGVCFNTLIIVIKSNLFLQILLQFQHHNLQGGSQEFQKIGAKNFHGEILGTPFRREIEHAPFKQQLFIYFAISLIRKTPSKEDYSSGQVQCTCCHVFMGANAHTAPFLPLPLSQVYIVSKIMQLWLKGCKLSNVF